MYISKLYSKFDDVSMFPNNNWGKFGLRADAFLKTLTNWREKIANYFSKRLTSGFVEGLNNKIKTIKRRCYSMTHAGHLFQRILLDLTGFDRFA